MGCVKKSSFPFKTEFSHLYLQAIINVDKSETYYINILQQVVRGLENE